LTTPYRDDDDDEPIADDAEPTEDAVPTDDSAPLYGYEEEEEEAEEEEEEDDDGGDEDSYIIDPVTKHRKLRTPADAVPEGS
jgi:hypothetical protein